MIVSVDDFLKCIEEHQDIARIFDNQNIGILEKIGEGWTIKIINQDSRITQYPELSTIEGEIYNSENEKVCNLKRWYTGLNYTPGVYAFYTD